MTSSASSSSSGGRVVALALALAAGAVGCLHARPVARAAPAPRVALLPMVNLTGTRAPVADLTEQLAVALARAGADVTTGEAVSEALARRRIRWLAGVDPAAAEALRDGLGVSWVIVPAIEVNRDDQPPRVALSVRVVTTDDPPAIVWAEEVARSGDEAPGLLARGVITSLEQLRREVVEALARSVATVLQGGAPSWAACQAEGRFAPSRAFRSPMLDDEGRRTVALLPFLNDSGRRDAGEVVALHFLRQLAASGVFVPVEPGVVRSEILDQRLILEGGVSVDQATEILKDLRSDLVLSGEVSTFEESAGQGGAPRLGFSVYLLDHKTGAVVWSSTSHARGDDGVLFFGRGQRGSASQLACSMVAGVVQGMRGRRSPLPKGPDATAAPGAPAGAQKAAPVQERN